MLISRSGRQEYKFFFHANLDVRFSGIFLSRSRRASSAKFTKAVQRNRDPRLNFAGIFSEKKRSQFSPEAPPPPVVPRRVFTTRVSSPLLQPRLSSQLESAAKNAARTIAPCQRSSQFSMSRVPASDVAREKSRGVSCFTCRT